MDSEREAKEVGPVGSHFLSAEERNVLHSMRSRGACVVVLTPEEMHGADPMTCKDVMEDSVWKYLQKDHPRKEKRECNQTVGS